MTVPPSADARLSAALADRYRIERELGAGGMATVYLAQDLRHDRRVALKVLKPELAAVLGADRFVQEIKTTAALQHPHILPLFDSGTADGFLYYVMPFIDGETLRSKLDRETQLGIEEAVRITTQVADALEYAHRHSVIHRDIKPENILLTSGHAVVSDFGIAKALYAAGGAALTATGFAIGTPMYMSPEQAMGERALDGRCDEYSLGCVLYEMLVGHPPHAGATAQSVIARRMSEVVPSLRTVRATVPEQLDRTVRRALAVLPADRFPTMSEFRDALPETLVPEVPPSRPRFRGRAYATVAIVVLAGAATLVWQWRSRRAPASPGVSDDAAVAVLPFRTVGEGLEFWHEGIVDLLSYNLDGVPGLREIDPGAVVTAWSHSDRAEAEISHEAIDVARRFGARYAVTGSAVRLGNAVRLAAQVLDVQRELTRGSVQVDGPSDSVSWLVDHLTLELLRNNLLPAQGEAPMVNLSRVTTTSVPALKAYMAGEQDYRVGRWLDAAEHYRNALDLDSTFARAAYRLARAYGWGGSDLADEYAKRAVRLADRLPERDAAVVRSAALGSAALDGLEAVTRRYPDDAEAWAALGDQYFHLGGRAVRPTSDYRTALTNAVTLNPYYAEAYVHLIEDAFMRLDSAAAGRLIREFASIGGDLGGCTYRMAYDLVWGSSTAREHALAALDTVSARTAEDHCPQAPLAAPPPVLDRLAAKYLASIDSMPEPLDRSILLFKLMQVRLPRGQIAAARRALDRVGGVPVTGRRGARWQVMLHLSGFPDALAVRHAAAVLSEGPDPTDRFWIGALAVEERRWTAALETIRALERQAPELAAAGDSESAGYAAAYADGLRSWEDLSLGRTRQLGPLEAAIGRFPPAGYDIEQPQQYLRFRVGELLIEWGRLPEAERYFESFQPYDFSYNTRAELYLGRIAQALGRPQVAAAHFARFLRWWELADAEYREPWREARAALDTLASSAK